MKSYLKRWVLFFASRIISWANEYKKVRQRKKYNFAPSVRLENVSLIGNVEIGENTYINEGSVLSSGDISKVKIGRHCAIGRYVHITAKTHSLQFPTSDENYASHKHIEKDTVIGNYVWIGDKAFIKEGISVGDYAIIGANSVVIKDVKPFEIVGGAPAKHIRFNTEHYLYGKTEQQ